MDYDKEAGEAELEALEALAVANNSAMCQLMMEECDEEDIVTIDHRSLRRSVRKTHRHDEALRCIQRDYLGIPGDDSTPLFPGKDFDGMFRMSLPRFRRLMIDLGSSGDPFYKDRPVDCFGREGASMEARILLALKSMAYGVPPHTFRDYFQMSKTLARTCCEKFNQTVTRLCAEECLRSPTACDLKAMFALHEHKHKVKGMVGSLDCMHTFWKNCPIAWQGSFKGAKKAPTIVLEGAADHHMWFWHVSCGHAGTNNDINVMNKSALQRSFVNGAFSKVELDAQVVPCRIASTDLEKMFFLVDGMCPRYSRFVKAVAQPVTEAEKRLTQFQESARKDIERAFGVLQMKFQCVCRPIHLMELSKTSDMVSASCVLHNMCVSDRVMKGDVHARHVPTNSFESPKDADRSNQPADYEEPGADEELAGIGVRNAPPAVQAFVSSHV